MKKDETDESLSTKMLSLFFLMGGSVFMSLFYIFGKLGENSLARREENVHGMKLMCESLLVLSILFVICGGICNTVGLGFGN